MSEQQSNENSQKTENSQEMYSYRSDNYQNNNNNNKNKNNPFQQSEAIRRSIGENNNINVNINPNPTKILNNKYSTNKFSQKPTGYPYNTFKSNNFTSNRMSQKFLNIQPDTFCYNWSTILIYLITELIAIILIATLFNWDQRNDPKNSCINNNINSTLYDEDKKLSDKDGIS